MEVQLVSTSSKSSDEATNDHATENVLSISDSNDHTMENVITSDHIAENVISISTPNDHTAENVLSISTANLQSVGASVGSVVILRSNPLDLPMVCGICGNQYGTATELESHMNIHRAGLPMKRSRGRPKGSKGKKLANEELSQTLPSNDPSIESLHIEQRISSVEEGDGSADRPRKRQRVVRKPASDDYIQDEEELDSLLGGHDESGNLVTYTKDTLPQFTREGVQIARLEDYMTEKMVMFEKGADGLDKGGSANVDQSGAVNVQRQTEDDGIIIEQLSEEGISEQVNNAMTKLISNEDMEADTANAPAVVDEFTTNNTLEISDGVEDDNATHIEVCLEVMDDGFTQKADSCDEDPETEQGKKAKLCELCFVLLPSYKMREHMISVHMNRSTLEFCCPKPGCDRRFGTIPGLRLHMSKDHQATINRAPPKAYYCEVDFCNTVHKSKHALKLHMSDAHGDLAQQTTSCEICHKIFKSKRAQSSHMKAHTKTLEPVNCQKCNKEFKHPSALKFHMSMMPECDKPKYVCNICGYKAVTPWRLNSHQQQVHSTERPFTCEYCHKTYKTNEMLKQHTYKLHTGTPTFECDQCHKKFFYAAELREHSQLHLSTKQFVCPICHRAFKTMHVFRGHMNGKHSDTWYSCGFCKFTTSHKKSMKRHMVLVHKLKNVTLEVTPEESTSGIVPQQVEIIQNESELHGLQLSETGQVINSIQHVQYEDVGNVVMQNSSGEIITHEPMTAEVITEDQIAGGIITHEQMSGEVITDEHIAGRVITHESMDEEALRQLLANHQAVVMDGSMNASEVSQVLVSLSSAVVTDAAADQVITTDTDHVMSGSVNSIVSTSS